MPSPTVDGTAGTAVAISAGSAHSCAIQAGSGAVICWGNDDSHQSPPTTSVDGVHGKGTAISAGTLHTLAIAVPEPASALLGATSGAMLLVLARRRAGRRSNPRSCRDQRDG